MPTPISYQILTFLFFYPCLDFAISLSLPLLRHLIFRAKLHADAIDTMPLIRRRLVSLSLEYMS